MPNCPHGIDSRFCSICSKPIESPETRKKKLQMKVQAQHSPKSAAEREALEAVYAYEEAKAGPKGKPVPASRTWQMIRRHGVIPAVELIVTRRDETSGYRVLVEMGLEDMAFEAVVLRHLEVFSAAAVDASRKRLEQLKKP